jgi:hypothetical protein
MTAASLEQSVDDIVRRGRWAGKRVTGALERVRCLLVFSSMVLWAGMPIWSQDQPGRKGLWASVQPGYGSIERSSDQEQRSRHDGFALAFKLGGTVNRYVRLGAELNGWLLESYDLNDPAKGESVSQILAIVQAYPWPSRGLFLKAGAGRATYTNHRPFEFGSSGWGATLGVGYDLRAARKISVTPVANYSRGSLGGVENQLVNIRNRQYSALDFGVAITYP